MQLFLKFCSTRFIFKFMFFFEGHEMIWNCNWYGYCCAIAENMQRHIICGSCCSCRQEWKAKISCNACWTWTTIVETGGHTVSKHFSFFSVFMARWTMRVSVPDLCIIVDVICVFLLFLFCSSAILLQVPLLLSIGEEDIALMKATESGDTDLVYLVLFHIWQKVLIIAH